MIKLSSLRKSQGITLIALVVTIVILLILSGVTINMLLGEDGIIRTAQDAKNTWDDAVANEQESIQNLVNELNSIMNDNGGTGGEDETPEDPTKGPNGKPLVETITEIQTENKVEAEDKYGNPVVVPKGFKVTTSEGTTVPEGIVIEDVNQNQFVWIPVGTVHKDSNPENDVTIELGRYTFNTSDGTPTPVQLAYTKENPTNYINEEGTNKDFIDEKYTELSTSREGKVDNNNHLNDLNTTAKNLAGFVESVRKNGGYYLARYEASYGSGYNSAGSTDAEKYANAKPLSKVSTANSTSSMTYDAPDGKLWNFITQLNASKVSQNMYKNDNSVGVESDLVNSYAWDTAIVFIQSMNSANRNYANKADGNGTLKNTGETGDEKCNIYDMAANVSEWTTEYSTNTSSIDAYPCTNRGGYYSNSTRCTAGRYYSSVAYSNNRIGFRVALYIK